MAIRINFRRLGNGPIALVFWIVFAVPLLGICAGAVSLKVQSTKIAQENANVSRQVEQKVSELQGLLNSLIGVHNATSGNQSALLVMAEKMRMDNPRVTAVGRYQNVSLFERDAFQELIAESGLYDYRIADLVGDKRVPSPPRKNATPISLLEPMTPALLPLLGSDLAVNSALPERLSAAFDSRSSVEIMLPDHWPAGGQLMVLQPATKVSKDSNESTHQSDGGYFIIIEPDAYLDGVLEEHSEFQNRTFELALNEGNKQKLLVSKRYSTQHLLGGQWLDPVYAEQVFELGDTSLVLSIQSARGIPRDHWATIAFFIVLATACFFAALAWLRQRGKSISQSEALQIDDFDLTGEHSGPQGANHGQFLWRGSNTKGWVLFVCVLSLVPILATIAAIISQRYQVEAFEAEGSDVARVVEQRIRQINGLFNSLVSANYATSGDPPALVAIAKQLRADNTKITAVGRYQTVPLWTRSAFEQSIANTSHDKFYITDRINGISVPSPQRSIALPISLLEPVTLSLQPLLGIDLAANKRLQVSLSTSVVQNSTVATAIPDQWPAANQLMLLQPAYRGLSAPEQYSARIQQADGGYLLIIDPQNYLEDIVDMSSQSMFKSVSLALDKFGEQTFLVSTQFPAKEQLGSGWFEAPRYYRAFEFNDASLVLTIEGTLGIPADHLITAVSFIFMAIASFVAALLWLQERRLSATEKLLSHDALRTERDRTARTLHLISDAVITVDRRCVIQHVNTTGSRFLNATQRQLIDKPLDDFLALRYREPASEPFNASKFLQGMQAGELIALDLVSTNPEEIATAFHGTVSLNKGSSENPATAVFVFRDISAEKRLTAALEHQANHDALTGCANRYCFERCLDDLTNKRSNSAPGNALLCIDLDRFKIINDSAGHAAGDLMLLHLTHELKQIVDARDTLARLGGDEFAILMSNVSRADAEKKALSVHSLFQTMVFNHRDRGFPIRASLGLAHFDEVGKSPAEVMAAADMACFAAKDLGRNQLYVYRAGDATIARRTSELEWLSLLRLAIENDRFCLYAQPLVSIKEPGRIARYEFLLRLVDEEGNILQADQIINAAERYGMMHDIDRWVIDHAFSVIAEQHADDLRRALIFAINLSGQSAADPTLIDYINDRIRYYRIDPTCLCFEITETAAISHFSNAVAFSQAIREMGAQIALDDFGAGLSSFAYLKNLPIDVLKIDGQFIRDMTSNTVDQAMVKAIRDVARSMQITTVAEFVESQAILEVLTDIGIDIAQGFHTGKPMPIENLLQSPTVVDTF